MSDERDIEDSPIMDDMVDEDLDRVTVDLDTVTLTDEQIIDQSSEHSNYDDASIDEQQVEQYESSESFEHPIGQTIFQSINQNSDPSLPASIPLMDINRSIVQYHFTPLRPPAIRTGSFLSSSTVCFAPIVTLWSWLTGDQGDDADDCLYDPSSNHSNKAHRPDHWSHCPSLLLAWSFAYLEILDIARLRSVNHILHQLLSNNQFTPICYASSSVSLSNGRWSTRAVQSLFQSVPFLTALSFTPLDEALASAMEQSNQSNNQTINPTTVNGLQPVSHSAAIAQPPVVNPRTIHLHSIFTLRNLRTLMINQPITPALTDADFFLISAHLSSLEMFSFTAPADSESLSAVGFSHLATMNHLAHVCIEYDEPERPRLKTKISQIVHQSNGVPVDEEEADEAVRSSMILKQESWLSLLRSRSLNFLQLKREGRAYDENVIWQQRFIQKNKKRNSDSSPPHHNRRSSLPIISQLVSIELQTATLLSLPSSSTFSFSLFFSSFSQTLESLTFESKPVHTVDLPLYRAIESALIQALPSFEALLHLSLSVSSFSNDQLKMLAPIGDRLVSFELKRSFMLKLVESNASKELLECVESWSTIQPDDWNYFLSGCTRLGSLAVNGVPFIVDASFAGMLECTPFLHSLSLSMLPVSSMTFSALLQHASLLYLDIHVHEALWHAAERGEMSEMEQAIWYDLSQRFKPFQHRVRLARMSVEQEEEIDRISHEKQAKKQSMKAHEWSRWRALQQGEWLDDDQLDELNEALEAEDEAINQSIKQTDPSSMSHYHSMTEQWTKVFYSRRLSEGEHIHQALARERWRYEQQALHPDYQGDDSYDQHHHGVIEESEGEEIEEDHSHDQSINQSVDQSYDQSYDQSLDDESSHQANQPKSHGQIERRSIGSEASPAGSPTMDQIDQLVAQSQLDEKEEELL